MSIKADVEFLDDLTESFYHFAGTYFVLVMPNQYG